MRYALSMILAACASAQTATPPVAAPVIASPTYFSNTGMRYSYYDRTLTETTNLGVHLTGASTGDVPGGLWAVVSVDATPRSQASSAGLRIGSRYFLKAVAGGDLIVYADIAAGATTTTTTAISAGTSGTVSSSLLGNLQGGMGFVWRACHTFNKLAKVNCIADLDYSLNAVSSQATKPLIGLFVGLAF